MWEAIPSTGSLDAGQRPDTEGKLLPLTSDADQRVVLMASSTLIERGFGKPRDDHNPKAEEPPKPKFNPALYTPAQQIEGTLRMIATAHVQHPQRASLTSPIRPVSFSPTAVECDQGLRGRRTARQLHPRGGRAQRKPGLIAC
jgi:hypothetical protein